MLHINVQTFRNTNTPVFSQGISYTFPTGNARHLTDPANKIYYATMEEGLYEVDVKILDVKTLFYDEAQKGSPKSNLHGYHGKGFYSGQDRVIYSNNGQRGRDAMRNPFTTSGVLAEWDGKADHFTTILEKQFTEVTGPDPIWSNGWDNPHLIHSTDGKTALWAGAVDDLWNLGKPSGQGGPWSNSSVKKGVPSDPYLMTGYDKKSLSLSTAAPCTITAQVDLTGNGDWIDYQTFIIKDIDQDATHTFPKDFQAYWIRFTCDKVTTATAHLIYE